MDEDLKRCTNCNRNILAGNFTTHVAHCVSRLTVCAKCKDSIPRSELQEHLETYHKEIPCDLCYEKMEKNDLEMHKRDICRKRLMKCPYCEIEAPANEMKEHLDYCGSRTELCKDCGQYVMLKDQEVHLLSDHCSTGRKDKKDNSSNIPNHQLKDIDFSNIKINKISNVKQEVLPKHSPSKRTNDMPQINTDATGIKDKDSNKPDIRTDGHNLSSEELDALLAMDLAELDIHGNPADNFRYAMPEESLFSSLPPSFMNAVRPDSIPFDSMRFWHEWNDDSEPNNIAQTNSVHFEVDSEDSSLPCEFCGEPYPADLLIQHQSGCRPDIAHGISDSVNKYEESTLIPLLPPVDDEPITLNENEIYNDDSTLIPCEFCQIDYPLEMLFEHQNICEENPRSQEASPAKELGENKVAAPNFAKATVPTPAKTEATAPFKAIKFNDIIHKNSSTHKENEKPSMPKPHVPSKTLNSLKFDDKVNGKFKTGTELSQTRQMGQSFPTVRNVPIRLAAHQPIKHTLEDSMYVQGSNSLYNPKFKPLDDELESANVKLFKKQVRKELKPLKDSLKTTGTRPKFQNLPESRFQQPGDHASRLSDQPSSSVLRLGLPRHVASADVNVQAAYRNHMVNKVAVPRLNFQNQPYQPPQRGFVGPSSNQESGSMKLSPVGRSGAVPKSKISKTPSAE